MQPFAGPIRTPMPSLIILVGGLTSVTMERARRAISVTMERTRRAVSILTRLLDVVDHVHVHLVLGRFHFQPELLKYSEDRGQIAQLRSVFPFGSRRRRRSGLH